MAELHSGSLRLADEVVLPGESRMLEIPVARFPTGTLLSLPVRVLNGVGPGPGVWLSSALHGDELNGIEIIRQVLAKLDPENLHGFVIAVPVVNVFGFLNQDRYLPDRRDLNRSFPGSANGSMAARLAQLFTTEIVQRCHYGIDFHTGSNRRINEPQVRCDLGDRESLLAATDFGCPYIVNSQLIKGSLRMTCAKLGIPTILYECGEDLRFFRRGINMGVKCTMRFLHRRGLLRHIPEEQEPLQHIFGDSKWIRARRSGIVHLSIDLGDTIKEGQTLGMVTDLFDSERSSLKSPGDGVVIGLTTDPLVSRGEAVINIALDPHSVKEPASGTAAELVRRIP